MTPKTFKQIRQRAGLSIDDLTRVILTGERTIRRYESGEYEISPQAALLMQMLDDGRLGK